MRIKVLRTLGDNEEMRGIVGDDLPKFREGNVLEVNNKVGKALMEHRSPVGRLSPLAEETDEDLTPEEDLTRATVRGVPRQADLRGVEDTSEVATLPVPDASDKISRMTSTDKLQHIAATDTREGVKKAAQKRLDELSNK